jgi:ribosome-associated toxin RatA of RatAB toxin-antitoxin module
MPRIKVCVKIKKPEAEVYGLIKKMEDFPGFMHNVKSLKIIKQPEENRVVTAWEAEIEGALLCWKEEDYFDDLNQEVRFSMLEGNYKGYRGRWLIEPANIGCRLTLEADFDWGIPMLEKYVGKALTEKARHGLLGMVQAVKSKIEKPYV